MLSQSRVVDIQWVSTNTDYMMRIWFIAERYRMLRVRLDSQYAQSHGDDWSQHTPETALSRGTPTKDTLSIGQFGRDRFRADMYIRWLEEDGIYDTCSSAKQEHHAPQQQESQRETTSGSKQEHPTRPQAGPEKPAQDHTPNSESNDIHDYTSLRLRPA